MSVNLNIGVNANMPNVGGMPENQGQKVGNNHAPNADAENNLAIPDEGHLPGPVLMHGSVGEPYVAPPGLKDYLNAAIEDRYTAGNFFMGMAKTIGRTFMNLCHAVKCLFCPSLNARDAASFDVGVYNPAGKLTNGAGWKGDYENRENVHESGVFALLKKNFPEKEAKPPAPVEYTPQEIGAAFGLRGEVKVAKFSANEVNFIRSGEFSLQDIKQDPGLQDCWFLSTLSSVLASCGREPLMNIIHVPPDVENSDGIMEPPDHAFVKLGKDVYKVPLGEVQTVGGDKSVSNSKPWVKLLETAMQMHLIKTSGGSITEGNVRMSYRNSKDGFAALFGVSRSHAQESVIGGAPGSSASFEDVAKLFSAHRPIVLGSKDGVGASLSTGISPGHAVAVLDVDTSRGPGKGLVTVLDPYGHTRVIQEKHLSNFVMVSALPEKGLSKDAMNDAGIDDDSFNIPDKYKWPDDSVVIDRIANPNYEGELNDPVHNNNERNNVHVGNGNNENGQYEDAGNDDF